MNKKILFGCSVIVIVCFISAGCCLSYDIVETHESTPIKYDYYTDNRTYYLSDEIVGFENLTEHNWVLEEGEYRNYSSIWGSGSIWREGNVIYGHFIEKENYYPTEGLIFLTFGFTILLGFGCYPFMNRWVKNKRWIVEDWITRRIDHLQKMDRDRFLWIICLHSLCSAGIFVYVLIRWLLGFDPLFSFLIFSGCGLLFSLAMYHGLKVEPIQFRRRNET